MQSIFRYPGGKSQKQIQEWICGHRPPGVKEYREPFVGGGGIYFSFAATAFERRWINDKHAGLIEVYRALRDRPEEFIAACRAIEPVRADDPLTEEGPRGGKPTNARLKATFEELKLNEECDQALRYYFVNRTVHGSGRVNYDIPSRLYFSNPDGWNIVASEVLETAADVIPDTHITCGDYEELFAAPGENVWIYADPPYVVNSNLSRTSQLYQHSFTMEDHRRFADVVKACKHKVCVSYDDDGSGLVRELFPEGEFWISEASWKYAGTTSLRKEDGRELLILNYEPRGTCELIVPESFQVSECLSREESERLEELELVLHRCFGWFVEAGKALREIRGSGEYTKRLYRETHSTFEEYCRDRWGLSRKHAFQLINASDKYEAISLSSIEDKLPQRETHVRELCRIESNEEAAQVWQKVVESVEDPKKITAKVIKQHVNEHLGEVPPKPTETDYEMLLRKDIRKHQRNLSNDQILLIVNEEVNGAKEVAA